MAQTKDRVNKAGINRFEFSGKVTKKDFKFSGKGNMWGIIKIEIPGKEDKFKSFMSVKLFGEIAEKAEQEIKEGDNYYFVGRVQNGSYIANDGTKKYTTDFIAFDYDAAEAAESTGGFSPTAGFSSDESQEYAKYSSKDDVPF